MRVADLHVDSNRLAELCEQCGVACSEVFGSLVRGDAAPDSDLDVLVTFKTGATVGLEFAAFQQALEELFGRSVDVLTRDSLERSGNKYFRRGAPRALRHPLLGIVHPRALHRSDGRSGLPVALRS